MAELLEPEKIIGALTSSLLLVPYCCDSEFSFSLLHICRANLENNEVRARIAVGECLGFLSKKLGTMVFEDIGEDVIKSIRKNFQRDEKSTEESMDKKSGEQNAIDMLLESSYEVTKPGTGEMRHGTEGWKCLETSFKALNQIIKGIGNDFTPYLSDEIFSILYEAVLHQKRFIRETSFITIGTIYDILDSRDPIVENEYSKTVKSLSKGLCDDWSQIGTERYADVFPDILPQMCLNRYYVAEGVRLYSQENWKMVVGNRGPELVADLAEHFITHYTKQCGANNHAVREAACACIAELMVKIETSAIKKYVSPLLRALVNCFKDSSWPVRDAACMACGRCILAFPDEALENIEEMYELWFAHLWDNIPSVRENSAISLGNAIRAYGKEASERILTFLRATINEATKQPTESVKFSSLTNTSKFGVAATIVDDTDSRHVDQIMFSCGSLAPKLARGGGCTDHGFKRKKEPWEGSDGCIYMVRELALNFPDSALEFMPAFSELLGLSGFSHCHQLHETIWRYLPVIAEAIGKRKFKTFLNDLLPTAIKATNCDNQLEKVSAHRFLEFLNKFIGPGILRGRLSEEDCLKLDNLLSVA